MREVAFRFVFLNYNPGRTPLFLGACAVALFLLWRGRNVGRSRDAIVLAAVAIGLPLLLAATGLIDVFFYRNLLPAWLPLAIGVAAGASTLSRVVGGALVVGSLACTLAVPLHVSIQRPSWKDAVHALQAGGPGRVVVLDSEVAALYWPQARPVPPAGARTSELDLVDSAPATALPHGLTGFSLAQTERAGNLYVFRFRSARPERLTGAVATEPNAAFVP
jgi:hypothetical protein